MKKRLLSFVLAVLMIASLLPATALAADIVDSGTCGAEGNGSNLTWTLDSEGVLTISGSGDMHDYDDIPPYKSPWHENGNQIRSVLMANGVTSIGNFAFYNCTSLTSVTIPDSVTSIGAWAFSGCASLTSVTIPDSVTSIDGDAFYNCASLASVTIPDSVTSIGVYAFYHCSSLTSVTIPDSVTSIGNSAFRHCTSLTSVTIPDSVTSIGDWAFSDCVSLTSVTIPDSVTSIGGDAFYNCTSLASVTIPDSVTSIGAYAFYDCTSLTSVTIPNSVTSIGWGAFSYCTSLTSVTIPNSVTSIGWGAFSYCTSLTSVTILDSVTSIGGKAFCGCTSLTSVTIPGSVTSIGDSAFRYCSSLTSVTIPDSVTSIGGNAFCGCTSLTSVTIPDSVTSIGNFAFDGCTSLTSVTIPDSVTSIDDGAFASCTSLTGIWVTEGNSHYASDASGVLFSKDKTTLVQCPGTLAECTIPDSVTSIVGWAFDGCASLTSVAIPNSVTSIGDCAFSGCESLTSVTIPNSVTSIDFSAFSGCTSLTDVYYTGSEAQWKAIQISYGNDALINAKIHYYSVDPGAYSSIYGADAQTRALTVYGNKNDSTTIETNYQALPGVEASGGADKRTTGKDGKVTLQNDGGSVTFHKDGYVDRTLSAAALNVSADVYLQKASDYPVINAVWLNDVNDVMNTRYPMNLVQSKRYKVEAEISWGSSSAKRVILYQGDKSYDITAGASSLVLSDRFDLSKALYIAATDQNNHTTVKKLKLESGSAATAALDGAKIDFGDSLKFTLPDSIPVIGGDSLKLGLYSQVPLKAVVDKGKVYVAIGYQVAADEDGVKSFANSAKKLRNSMTKAKTEAQKYKTMQDARKAFGGKAATVGGSWGFDAGFTVMGFAEG